jgi:UDP-2,3-diacylglucosamine pyrophosphatase LpxH
MGNRYLIVSDLHLCDVEDHADGWKAYKSSRYLFDREFADLLKSFVDNKRETERLVLIFNGDTVDFDLVVAIPEKPAWPVSFSERRRGLDATEAKAVWKLERVLSDHPVFVDALAGFLSAGHQIVFILGNHDREFHFEAVRQAFVSAVRRRAQEKQGEFTDVSIRFEPWFYFVPGEIYAEHGQQYDYYTSFRYLLSPVVTVKKQKMIALPMGNLSNRYLMNRMGFFNPHATDYILNIFSYVTHWLKKYAFTRRSLLCSWLWGSLVVIGKLLRMKRRLLSQPPEMEPLLRKVADRFDLEPETVESLYRLQRPPITSRFFRIFREFWIDRTLLALVLLGGTITLALVPVPLWIKLMVPLTGFPLLYFIYEWLARGETVFTIEKQFPNVAREVSNRIDARVVTFGHTHVPRLIPLSKNVSFVDTGSWAPIMKAPDPQALAPGLRNYLIVSFDGDKSFIKLDSWQDRVNHELD